MPDVIVEVDVAGTTVEITSTTPNTVAVTAPAAQTVEVDAPGSNILGDPAWSAADQFVVSTGAGTAEVKTAAEARALLKERTTAPSDNITGNLTIDIADAEFFDLTQTVDAPILTFECSETPPSGQMIGAVIRVRQHSSALKTTFTVAGVSRWASPNLPPVLPQVLSDYVDFLVTTYDGLIIEGNSPTLADDLGLTAVEDVTGTSYSVVSDDHDKVKRFTNASLVTVTLPQAIGVGRAVELLSWGAGGLAVQGDGTSVVNTAGTIDQYESAHALVVAADIWSVRRLVPPTPAAAGIQLVQSKGATITATTNGALTFDTPPQEDNLLVCMARVNISAASVVNPTGATKAVDDTFGSNSWAIWFKVAGAAESSTFGPTCASSVNWNTVVAEFSGLLTASVLDKVAETDPGTPGTSLPTGSTGVLSQAVELAVAMCALGSTSGGSEAVDSGFSLLQSIVFAGKNVIFAYKIVSATTALNPSFSWVTSGERSAGIATFKGL